MRRPWNWFPSDFQHYEASATGGSFLSDGPNAGPAIELIRAATGTPDGSGNYDAFVRRFNGTVYSDTEEVWMRIPNGETVTSGNQYLARLMQYASGRKVYTASIPGTGGGGGTGGAVLRVPSVGSGLVAAFVETWTDTAGAPMPADGTACYVFDPNANAINAQYYPGILTINHSDGKPIYAVQSGFTGTESICLGDGQYHTFTWAAGDLISVV
jgi:hypothetical protein